MKKFYILFFALSIVFVANSQNENQGKITSLGDFVVINQTCKTSVNNEFSNLTIVNKVILKKSVVTSIVILFEHPDEKGRKENTNKVVVSTTEKIIHYGNGVSSKAMGNSFKSYEFLFDESTNVDAFAIELTRLCSLN